MTTLAAVSDRRVLLPPVPVVATAWNGAVILTPEGEIEELPLAQAAARLTMTRPIVCHGPATAARLRAEKFLCHDALELFAFVRPAAFALPTVRGLAGALGIDPGLSAEDRALALLACVRKLLEELRALPELDAKPLRHIAASMGRSGWSWSASVLAALGDVEADAKGFSAAHGLRIWLRLPEWEEMTPPPPPGNESVSAADSEARLATLLGAGAETREPQRAFARAVAAAFQPRDNPEQPRLVLAEAGTGVGKTLGYVAPASVWAEKNAGAVWLSTFTRNLQRQLDQELDRLCPDAEEKARRVVIRKGRENYFCLLSYEEAVNRLATHLQDGVALGLLARWASATRSGDMVGGDLPGWLPEILGRDKVMGLADRRGECIYAACTHYQKCFIERTVRRARTADIVVANHALVMAQAAMGGLDDATRPTRYVFDEGHHIFESADSAFSAHLSGLEGADLRRWLMGAEKGPRSRARGLKKRAEGLLDPAKDKDLLDAVEDVLQAARVLPSQGWRNRLKDNDAHGPAEAFLQKVRQQVYARADTSSPYSLEADTSSPVEGLLETAEKLDGGLARLEQALRRLMAGLETKLDVEASELDTNSRMRLEAMKRTLERRGLLQVSAWRSMLASLKSKTPPEFVDWFAVERYEAYESDVGLYRHWVDPTLPFARALADHAQGIAITSATLLNGAEDEALDWSMADARVGAAHLAPPVERTSLPSPFDFENHTRVIVVTDVRKDDLAQVGAAYRELFLAAGGGALGLFTAISRLKDVHRLIADPVQAAGIDLYAQHVDAMDTGTLVDIFRAEEDACLLGTDALREGVDVPGRSLRLVVFDRVPWPRPDILHKARRVAFGRKTYDDAITRLRLKQAFGRLIRRATDRGIFVLLDPMMPSRLKGAFPPTVPYKRCGLAEAVATVKGFLAES